MVRLWDKSVAFIFILVSSILHKPTVARRPVHHRRQDVFDVDDTLASPSVARSGWTAPLEGSKTCTTPQNCTYTLSAPPSSSYLQYLAIGRGTITYSCDGRSDKQSPVFVTQNANLYDTASLVTKFASEDQFHSYIPRFLQYDYTSLDNSTLSCIGDIQRVDGLTVFDIFKIDAYTVTVKELVNSPHDTQFNLPWAHVQSNDGEWDIYRVETAGGAPPYNCGDQIISEQIPVEYVAEYWFYRRQ